VTNHPPGAAVGSVHQSHILHEDTDMKRSLVVGWKFLGRCWEERKIQEYLAGDRASAANEKRRVPI
jgi:hypothetical protein